MTNLCEYIKKIYFNTIIPCACKCGFSHYTIGIIKGVQEPYTVVLVLFCCLKIFLNPFTDRITNLISVVSVRAERGKNLYAFTVHRKEVRL